MLTVEYKGSVLYSGNPRRNEYLTIVDRILEDSLARFKVDSLGRTAKESSLIDVDFRVDYLLLVAEVTAEYQISYVYIVNGDQEALADFSSMLEAIADLKNHWEFTIETDYVRTLHRGDKLALIDCADKIYKDALMVYAVSTDWVDESLHRVVTVVETTSTQLVLNVSYGKITTRYVLTGSAAYILELDYYFKGIYEDYDKALHTGAVAAATVCSSITEISQRFGRNIMGELWFSFKMDGTLTGDCFRPESTDFIVQRALSNCILFITDWDDSKDLRVEYVCNFGDNVIWETHNIFPLVFLNRGINEVFTLDIYARVFVDGAHFMTFRYRVQDRLPCAW